MRTQEDWQKIAMNHTDGDMVIDILSDWNEDRKELLIHAEARLTDAEKKFKDALREIEHLKNVRDAMLKRAKFAEKEINGFEDFHPRAVKLLRKRKNFLVIADDEPYFTLVYSLIRSSERLAGRWTDEDEKRYEIATGAGGG